jgi:hypothetical protein
MDSDTKRNMTIRIIKDSLVFQYMPNPSTVIRSSLRGLKTFDDMLKDSRVVGLFYDRRNATQNLPLSVSETGDKKVDAYVKRYLTEKRLRKWSNYLLTDALKYGFRPGEIIWDQDGQWLHIDSIIGHDIDSYRFKPESGEMYYTKAGMHLCDEPYKWIVHRIEGDRLNNPYGVPYMEAVYWPWQFKRMGWQFWLTATERFAVPTLLALFEQTDPAKAEETSIKLADLLSEINSGSSGAMANVKEIKQVDMGGKVSDFDSLIAACDLQISYGMTGQALANSVSDTGTQALGTVQERTKSQVYENDARALAYTMQALIDMAIEVNFGSGAPTPEIQYDTGDYAPFTNVMSAIDHGIPISETALYTRYALPKPTGKQDEFVRPAAGSLQGLAGGDDNPPRPKATEPPVQPQKPAITPEGGAAVAETGAGVTLNGAQVQAATAIVMSVEAGELPRDSGVAQLKILFNLSGEQAEEMMGSAGRNPKPKVPADFADSGKKKARRMMVIL